MQRITWLIATACILLSFGLPLQAQEKTSLIGKVQDSGSGNGIGGVLVTLENNNQQTSTAADGSFAFYNIKAGSDKLLFSSPMHKTIELSIRIIANEVNKVGSVVMHQDRINDNAHFAGIIDNIDLDQIDEEAEWTVSQHNGHLYQRCLLTKCGISIFAIPPSQSRL